MKASEMLKAARKLIENQENWTQGSFAQNIYGEIVDPQDLKACKFCARGALDKVHPYGDAVNSVEAGYLHGAAAVLKNTDAISLNDETDHATVLTMFDVAIAKAESVE